MSDIQGHTGGQGRQDGASAAGVPNMPGNSGQPVPSSDMPQNASALDVQAGTPRHAGPVHEQWQPQHPQQQWQGQPPQSIPPQPAQPQFQSQDGQQRLGGSQYGGPWQGGLQPGPQFGGGQQYPSQPMGAQHFGQPGHRTTPGGPDHTMAWGGSQIPAGDAKVNVRATDGSLNRGLVAHAICAAAQLFVILGSIGPWASIFGISISGVRGDGKITLVLALVALAVLGAVVLGKLPKVAVWGVVAISVINLFIGFADTTDYMAWGLLFVILFSLIGLVAAVAGALLPNKGSTQKGGPGTFSPTRV